VADNAFAFGYLTTNTIERNPNDIKSIQGFNHYFRSHPQFFTSIIPIGDGMIAGVKIA
jgi:predicted O-methyltransferase YrrM